MAGDARALGEGGRGGDVRQRFRLSVGEAAIRFFRRILFHLYRSYLAGGTFGRDMGLGRTLRRIRAGTRRDGRSGRVPLVVIGGGLPASRREPGASMSCAGRVAHLYCSNLGVGGIPVSTGMTVTERRVSRGQRRPPSPHPDRGHRDMGIYMGTKIADKSTRGPTMIANVRARYSNGVLTPLEPLDLEEGKEVTPAHRPRAAALRQRTP